MADSEVVRTVYVMLTHRDWAQAHRLASAILSSSPAARVLITHDSRVEAFPVETGDQRIRIFRHGFASDWGSWEIVLATLAGFAEARRWASPDLVCLISGQDYPLRNLAEWESAAIAAPSWVGQARPLYYRPRWGTRLGEGDDTWTRYAYVWLRTPAARLGLNAHGLAGRMWRRVRDAVGLRAEPILGVRVVARGRGVHYGVRRLMTPFSTELPCYSGSQWVALRRHELDALLDVDLAPGSRLARLYERSLIPDESALVTPLSWRAPPSELPPVTKVEWLPDLDRPRTYTLEHLAQLVSSGSPFCRKVDPVVSATLLDELDRRIAAG